MRPVDEQVDQDIITKIFTRDLLAYTITQRARRYTLDAFPHRERWQTYLLVSGSLNLE